VNILALDTSSDACSVALQTDAGIADIHEQAPREHTRILIPMIDRILRENELELANLDTIVLGNGPGSFIGMRIGASVAQGLAFGAGLQIVPISSLAAVAAEVFEIHEAAQVLVAQDARMGEVYFARFTAGADGLPTAADEVCLHRTADPLPDLDYQDTFAAGAGWERYPELNASARRSGIQLADTRLPSARFLLAAGLRDWRDGKALDPDVLEPAYVRMRVASVPGS
jgi:tRNA threonylcarbamoyladenosine biosynthesis protein TsaB